MVRTPVVLGQQPSVSPRSFELTCGTASSTAVSSPSHSIASTAPSSPSIATDLPTEKGKRTWVVEGSPEHIRMRLGDTVVEFQPEFSDDDIRLFYAQLQNSMLFSEAEEGLEVSWELLEEILRAGGGLQASLKKAASLDRCGAKYKALRELLPVFAAMEMTMATRASADKPVRLIRKGASFEVESDPRQHATQQ